jgi:hypothetical protein
LPSIAATTHPVRRVALAVVPATAVTLGTGAALAAAAGGGLSMSPAIIQHIAKPGPVGSVVVTNTSGGPLKVTVTPRPWKQSRSGAVTPARGKTLRRQIRVSASAFTLAAGKRRTIKLTLRSKPSRGSLYGSLDIVGTPPKKSQPKSGIIASYRLIGSLRLDPPAAARRFKLTSGRARVSGRTAVVAIRNAGNTVAPLSGSWSISGKGRTIKGTLPSRRILPGTIVEVPLGSVKGLAKGTYRVRAAFFQNGKPVLVARPSLKVG